MGESVGVTNKVGSAVGVIANSVGAGVEVTEMDGVGEVFVFWELFFVEELLVFEAFFVSVDTIFLTVGFCIDVEEGDGVSLGVGVSVRKGEGVDITSTTIGFSDNGGVGVIVIPFISACAFDSLRNFDLKINTGELNIGVKVKRKKAVRLRSIRLNLRRHFTLSLNLEKLDNGVKFSGLFWSFFKFRIFSL